MHDIFGVDILNIFDLRQEDEDRLQGKKRWKMRTKGINLWNIL